MQGVAVMNSTGCGNGLATVTCGPEVYSNWGRRPKSLRCSACLEPRTAFSEKSLMHVQLGPVPVFVRGRNWSKKEKNFCVRAVGNHGEQYEQVAPLQLESPTGQFLSQLLKDNPYLFPAAVEQQLERLIAEQEADSQQEPNQTSGTEVVLYRRIAELKAAERRKALEEIIYALIVQKFIEAGVSLIPSMSNPDPTTGKVDTWLKENNKLEKVHTSDALEMIGNHLNLVLGNRMIDSNAIAQISKMRVGQVYTASVMYGYFLKRVDQRFQLEKSMKLLPSGLNHESDTEQEQISASPEAEDFASRDVQGISALPSMDTTPSDLEFNASLYSSTKVKPCKLRTYVMSFDQETLQRYTTMRSKEGVSIIEKHAEALFGKPEVQIVGGKIAAVNDEVIRISFSGLTNLVLEAVTFGSFLWDIESYVDSKYPFLVN